MDTINVLGDQNERFKVFTKELLAETTDEELQQIVQMAADELSSPIALVSLVLDQIQFFKAFVGLPADLAASRGTHRDASFCQFVVRDGEAFEVNDAPNDPRIPQYVVNYYNIQSYLGVPIKVKDTVVGSLCVLDTKKRGFSDEEHKSLHKLGKLVNKRLDAITKERRQTRLKLTESSLKPALSELSSTLQTLQDFISLSNTSSASVRLFLDHFQHYFSKKNLRTDAIRMSYEAATKAHQMIENFLLEIEFGVNDSMDCVQALEKIAFNVDSISLSEILIAAQDLARNATKAVGGFTMPDVEVDPIVYTKGSMAIAVVTNALLIISYELSKKASDCGINLKLSPEKDTIKLLFLSNDLDKNAKQDVVGQLTHRLGKEHPTISVEMIDDEVGIKFKSIAE